MRGLILASVALGVCCGLAFALRPDWDIDIARWFYDQEAARFPLATAGWPNTIRSVANWLPWLLVLPAGYALLRKLVLPNAPMSLSASVTLYLIGSFLIGPGLVSNMVLKEHWGRPRPNQVQQFAGTAAFEPWWRPGGACAQNCSFVSGEASEAFWTIAPASLAPGPLRPVAMAGAVAFGAIVGGLRVAFGRHFLSDVIFAAVITMFLVALLYRLMIDPLHRNDARLERLIERFAAALHRSGATVLAQLGKALTTAGGALHETGQHLRKRVACL